MPYSSPIQPLRSPASPSSSSTTTSVYDSFVIVRSDDEDEDEAETGSTSSTINTDILDALSSDSEPRHPSSLGGSFHGDLSEADDHLDFIQRDPSFDDSYIDAEATATASLLTESRGTIGQATDVSSSPTMPEFAARRPSKGAQFQFIFPHPEASFSSSSGTFTGGVTPSGSLANLRPTPYPVPFDRENAAGPVISGIGNDAPFARLGGEARQKREKSTARGVDEGWLKDARTWAPTHEPVTMLMPSWEKGQYDSLDEQGSAVPAEKEEKVIKPVEDNSGDYVEGSSAVPEPKLFFPVNDSQLQLKRALRAVVAAGAGGSGNRWGLLAFASCALAILGAFGPGMTYLSQQDKTGLSPNVTSSEHDYIQPIHAATSLSEVLTNSNIPSTTSEAHIPRSLATQLIPDLQSIRDALSTFTSGPKPGVRSETAPSSGTVHRCFGKGGHESVALTPKPDAKGGLGLAVVDDTGFKAWMRAVSNAVSPTAPVIPPAPTAVVDSCNCTTASPHIENRYAYLIQRTQDYAISTTLALAQLYHPMMLHLDHELRELSRLANYIAEREITQTAVRHLHTAKRGARKAGLRLAEVSARQRKIQLERLRELTSYASTAWEGLRRNMLKRRMVEQEALRHLVQTAQVGLGKLGEKADEVKSEGERSLRTAKKGLNQLIQSQPWADALVHDRRAGSERRDEPAVNADWDADRIKVVESMMKSNVRQRFTRSGRLMRERRSRAIRRKADVDKWAESEGDAAVVGEKAAGRKSSIRCGVGCRGQTRWRRLLEAVHHGAIQIVLQ